MALAAHAAWLLTALAAVSPLMAAPQNPGADPEPRSLIMLISDGCGPASFTLARTALGRPLALDEILVGNASTFAEDTLVTDSAASATAFSAGFKTQNGVLGLDAEGLPVATLLEAAEDQGLATGLITTTRLTHATPAAFASHVPSRGQSNDIAVQMLEHHIEVLFGGGSRHFLPESRGGKRTDGRDLIAEASERGVTTLSHREALLGRLSLPVLGLFASSHLDYEIDRDKEAQPSLAEMTERALQLLSAQDRGFLLMIEAGRIDHAGHGNDPVGHLHDIAAYDATVTLVLDFARDHSDTLVVATSDHETGGLSLSRDLDGKALYAWHPEVLNKASSSASAMAARLHDGGDPKEIFAEGAAISDLTAAELDILDGDDSLFADPMTSAQTLAAVCDVINRRAGLSWTTTGHTGVDVPVFAYGPGASDFRGHQDNTDLCDRIAKLFHFDLEELTQRLRAGETPWWP